MLSYLLAQINPTVGAIEKNLNKILNIIHTTQIQNPNIDLLVFPELALTGYPPEDLLFRSSWPEKISKALDHIREAAKNITIIIGHPVWENKDQNNIIYNSASVFSNQKLLALYHKQALPNYGVFDERRYFTAGNQSCIFQMKNQTIGLLICEDGWSENIINHLKNKYLKLNQNLDLIIQINASPFSQFKYQERLRCAQKLTHILNAPLLSVYQTGGQDELIFDGGSFILNQKGQCVQSGKFFEEDYLTGDIKNIPHLKDLNYFKLKFNPLENLYKSLVFAVREYVHKSGFKSVILGLSGGIDSALTLAIAVDALGKECVKAVMMPSPYTADISLEDAEYQVNRLNVDFYNLSIEPTMQSIESVLKDPFENTQSGLAEENIQARIRGLYLMALSNKFGHLVLTTGNKSEVAVGYSTLYGDMAGGFDVLKDVYKTEVYQLSKYRNKIALDQNQDIIIPERVITRAPSAELRPDQIDQDSLPDYEILDQILKLYIEQNKDLEDIILEGFDKALVQKIISLIKRSEYKRRQAPLGPKLTQRAFGKDWRLPVVDGS